MNDHAAELDEIITAHLKGWTLPRVPRVSLVALRLALAEMLYGEEQKPVLPSMRPWSWSRNTVPRMTTSSSTAFWVPLRVSAARPMNQMLTLGIDTSNYATSLAVFDTDAGEVVCDCKKFCPSKRGSSVCARATPFSTTRRPCRRCWPSFPARLI